MSVSHSSYQSTVLQGDIWNDDLSGKPYPSLYACERISVLNEYDCVHTNELSMVKCHEPSTICMIYASY